MQQVYGILNPSGLLEGKHGVHDIMPGLVRDTPPKFNSEFTPEKWWLEDDPFLLGFGNFSRATLQGINISHLGKRKIIFKSVFWQGMLNFGGLYKWLIYG